MHKEPRPITIFPPRKAYFFSAWKSSLVVAGVCIAFCTAGRAKAAETDSLSGIYIGAFAGYASLNTTLVTPATSVTTNVPAQVTVQTPLGPQTTIATVPATIPIPSQRLKDQGGSGPIFGLRAGYGRLVWDSVYLGAEVEVTFPQLAESHLQFMGRSIKAHLQTEGGLYLRAGWTPNQQTLFFVRAGIAAPRQVIQSGALKVERWTVTPAVGLGIEHALTRHLSARLDVNFMPAVTDNQIGSIRGMIGIAYRF